MKKIKFLTFELFALLAAVTLDSYSQNNNITNSLTYDEGVVINGIKWATRNVDEPGMFTAKLEDAGMFYQWNRKVAWPATGDVTGWNDTHPEGDAWEKANDPCPAGWRAPTFDEIKTLLDTAKVSSKWTIENGINGRKFIDRTTNNSLFLPAVGNLNLSNGMLRYAGEHGNYCSSTAHKDVKVRAYSIFFNSNVARQGAYYRSLGFNVRCVTE